MAGFLKSNTASLANGSKVVQITGGLNCSFVGSGTAVYINDVLLEGVAGTAADPSGNSTITLRDTFTGVSVVNGTLTAFNTIEGLRDAIQRARELSLGLTSITTAFGDVLTATTPTIDIDIGGVITPITPYGYLSGQVTDLVAVADGAADTLIALQGDVDTLANTVSTIQGDLDSKVSAANLSATNAAASELASASSAAQSLSSKEAAEAARDITVAARDVTVTAKDVVVAAEAVVVAAETVVTTAEGVVTTARDEVITARDVTLSAKDTVVASELVVTTAEGVVITARDATLAARDITLGYRDSAATSEANSASSAVSASNDAALAQEWAVSPNIIGVDQRSSKYWAEFAKENADLTSVSGGVFTPTLVTEYPTVSNPTRDTTFLVSFADPSDSYTFTTGDLIGTTVFSTYILFWDADLSMFKVVTSPSGAAILSINGKTGSTITLTSIDIPHGATNVSAALALKVNTTDVATTTVAGITTLSNSFSGIDENKAVTEKALSDGLATKAALIHQHAGEDITSGTVAAERLPDASTTAKGATTLSSSIKGASESLAVTEKALTDSIAESSATTFVYTGGDLTQMTETLPRGERVTDFTYTSGTLTQLVEVYNGVTATTTYTYDGSGTLTGVTRV